jgi:hypothetical protein
MATTEGSELCRPQTFCAVGYPKGSKLVSIASNRDMLFQRVTLVDDHTCADRSYLSGHHRSKHHELGACKMRQKVMSLEHFSVSDAVLANGAET